MRAGAWPAGDWVTAAYYNENDEYAAQWLRNLIAPGDVDTRSIEDIHPHDLRPYAQCHFFAGIGVWSLALRRAGWPDDSPIWTGSCPCQPFSAAGEGAGFNDERHLWPAWNWLIAQRNPAIVLGEQVASRDAEPWIDLVSADLEGLGYAVGALAFPSAGVGSPHIRDRLYWVAYAGRSGLEGWSGRHSGAPGYRESTIRSTAEAGESSGLEHADGTGRGEGVGDNSTPRHGAPASATCGASGLADSHGGNASAERKQRVAPGAILDADTGAGPTNGYWRDADWLYCRDGKWRPVRPGTFPLAHGAPARVGRLRAYGNAINVEAACVFIDAAVKSILECEP